MLALAHFPPLIDPERACLTDARLIPDMDIASQAPVPCRVATMWINLSASPSEGAACLTSLLYGELFERLHDDGTWAYGRSVIDGYMGWVPSHSIQPSGDDTPNAIVSTPLTNLYSKADIKAPPTLPLPFGALLTLQPDSLKNGFMQTTSGGWVFAKHLRDLPCSDGSLVETALTFLNAPYLWGGRTVAGLDCSALIQLCLLQSGLRVHRDSDLQFSSLGTPIDRTDAKRGDLVFFSGHVGVLLDATTLLHANATRMKVSIDPVSDVTNWVTADLKAKGKNQPAVLGVKRLL